ncbi:MAG TPA: hypothetical protein VN887_03620 [Candidatus Angelobacter sp.]|nr:hypothetical protein [Candidatus Angelobacter sp.]
MSKSRFLALASLSFLCFTHSRAVTLTENFSASPDASGWKIFGDTNLFRWNSTNQNLEVTWDSSRTNSYFYHPLGTILARDDDFSLEFDLRLNDIGPADSYAYSFQIALGFLNLDQATRPTFLRGTGSNATNLVEFVYFRDDPFGDPATVYPTFVDQTGQFNYNQGRQESTNYSLATGDWFHVAMDYRGSNQTLVTSLTNLSQSVSATVTQQLGLTFSGDPFTDFRLDSISINSYNEAGQFPGFEGSVLAHGNVDNLAVTVPPPPIQNLAGGFSNALWQVQFLSRSNWLYTLERSADFQLWTNASTVTPGTGSNVLLQDASPPASNAFYRVRAQRP